MSNSDVLLSYTLIIERFLPGGGEGVLPYMAGLYRYVPL